MKAIQQLIGHFLSRFQITPEQYARLEARGLVPSGTNVYGMDDDYGSWSLVWQCFEAHVASKMKQHFHEHARREREACEREDKVADRLICQGEARLNKKQFRRRRRRGFTA